MPPHARRVTKAASRPLSRPGLHVVLAPIDLTAGSDRSLGRVTLLPLAEGARVTLLHVVPDSPLSSGQQQRATRDAKRMLDDEARHLREQLKTRKVIVSAVVRRGGAAKEIAACAREEKAELIVMGRGGRRAVREAVLGSTAERVIRQAQRPVLVVRLPPRRAYVRPALALDLDRAGDEVVRLMLSLLPPPWPRVDVVHAVELPSHGLIYPSLSDEETERQKDELRAQAVYGLARLLASGMAKANVEPDDGPVWRSVIRWGSPRVVVERAIDRAENDLLVLGTRGTSSAVALFLGTVAGDLVRAAACDVLVVPPLAASSSS